MLAAHPGSAQRRALEEARVAAMHDIDQSAQAVSDVVVDVGESNWLGLDVEPVVIADASTWLGNTRRTRNTRYRGLGQFYPVILFAVTLVSVPLN